MLQWDAFVVFSVKNFCGDLNRILITEYSQVVSHLSSSITNEWTTGMQRSSKGFFRAAPLFKMKSPWKWVRRHLRPVHYSPLFLQKWSRRKRKMCATTTGANGVDAFHRRVERSTRVNVLRAIVVATVRKVCIMYWLNVLWTVFILIIGPGEIKL